MQFIDECVLELKAGNGGNGIVAWRREAHNPYGGPYGGNGGDGGSIILIGDINENTLLPLRNHKIISAANGENGQTKLATGKSGENTFIKVPLGTVVYDYKTNKQICEILQNGQEYIIQSGGKGGHGNAWFKNSQNKIPNLHENGDIVEPTKVKLVIKYMADIGLVGLPNAGKSTLISKLTTAHPKITNYQFTTLSPVLGVCKYHNQSLVIADIPGLIEGASEGKGLGYEFLKHIERCSILIHLISLDTSDNQDIIYAYQTITNELLKYNAKLLQKKIILVANKNDVSSANKNYLKLKQHLNSNIICISAKESKNLDQLLNTIFKDYLQIKSLIKNDKKENIKYIEVTKVQDPSQNLSIEKIADNDWNITSPYLKYWTNRIPLDTSDNIIRYNEKLKKIKLEERIKKMGGIKGDTLHIYGNELLLE